MVIYTDGAITERIQPHRLTLYCSHYFKYQLSEQNCNRELSKEEKKERKGEKVNGERSGKRDKTVASGGGWLTGLLSAATSENLC